MNDTTVHCHGITLGAIDTPSYLGTSSQSAFENVSASPYIFYIPRFCCPAVAWIFFQSLRKLIAEF